MPRNYGLVTSAKINVLYNTINEHPDWGSTRLQNAIKERFGSQLKKDYLLRESKAYRQSKGIEEPQVAYKDYRHLGKVLREGKYSTFEKDQFIKQIARYDSEGRKNFVYSETLKDAAKSHSDWLQVLLTEARKSTKNMTQAKALVFDRLKNLSDKGEYDPFVGLREVYRPRPVKRDYDERRRNDAIRRKNLVADKIFKR